MKKWFHVKQKQRKVKSHYCFPLTFQTLDTTLQSSGPSEEILRLMIEYKREEVKLTELQLQLVRESQNRDTMQETHHKQQHLRSDIPVICNSVTDKKYRLGLRPKRLRNFGQENCAILTREKVELLFIKYTIPFDDDITVCDYHNNMSSGGDKLYKVLSRDLLKLIWLNRDLPENQNLRVIQSTTNVRVTSESTSMITESNDLDFLVYYDQSWSSVYWLTVICEYIKGMLYRLELLLGSTHPDLERLRDSVFSNMDAFNQDFCEILKTGHS